MAKFYNISLQEMQEFFDPNKGWSQGTQGKEVVFNYPIKSKPHLLIRIYTGIRIDTEQSRDVGKDAIRVCAVNLATNRGWIKASRVYRVEGWRANLKTRVLQVIDEAKNRLNSSPLPHVPYAMRREMAAERQVWRIEAAQR